MKIKDFKKPVLMLAPMEGITNRHFRDEICKHSSVDIVATEFIRITSSKQKIKPFPTHSAPLQVQFMASNPEMLRDSIVFVKEKGLLNEESLIDLNVGCPSKRVNAHGAGAALLCEPNKLKDMILKVREVHSGTLSVKTRVGYQSDEDYPKILSMLEDCPLDFISIHARTKKDGYEAPVNLTYLKKAVEALPYPVIGNGEIWTAADAIKMIKETGVSGVMCGRGAVSNPFIFSEIKARLENKPSEFSKEDLIKFIINLLRKYQSIEKETGRRYIGSAKELCVWLSKNPKLGRSFFQSIKRMNNIDEIIGFLKEIKLQKLCSN